MKRYEELDSLRGLAALTVLFSHIVLAIDLIGKGGIFLKVIDKSPIHLLYAGHEAVIFFFLLSGFVLTLPFLNGKRVIFSDFIIKRIIRIYLPVFSMLVFALVSIYFVKILRSIELTGWLGDMWNSDITFLGIINHLLLIGLFDYNSINPVIWSLVHEMRISLFFPLILLLTFRFNWKVVIIVALTLSAFGGITHVLWGAGNISIGKTIHYTSMFIVGSLLAKYKDVLISSVIFRSKVTFIFAILLYTYPFWFFKDISVIHNTLIDDWASTIGASLFLILALTSKRFSRFLKMKPINFLGRISFSLYLFHLIIILIVFNLFEVVFPIWVLVLSSIVLSLIVATLNYLFIERYSMRLGKKIIETKKAKASVNELSA